MGMNCEELRPNFLANVALDLNVPEEMLKFRALYFWIVDSKYSLKRLSSESDKP